MIKDTPNGQTQYLVDGEPVAMSQEDKPVAWEGAEEWEPLAYALCAEEHGEESCNDLIWEGRPIPEPWGERWLKYEYDAKRMIALVRDNAVPKPVAAQEPLCWLVRGTILKNENWMVFFRDEFHLVKSFLENLYEGRPTHEGIALYTNAAPCARCAGKDQLIAEQNKLNKERQEWALHTNEVISGLNAKLAERDEEIRTIRANLAQLEKDFDRRNERIEALEAEVERLTLSPSRNS